MRNPVQNHSSSTCVGLYLTDFKPAPALSQPRGVVLTMSCLLSPWLSPNSSSSEAPLCWSDSSARQQELMLSEQHIMASPFISQSLQFQKTSFCCMPGAGGNISKCYRKQFFLTAYSHPRSAVLKSATNPSLTAHSRPQLSLLALGGDGAGLTRHPKKAEFPQQ